jgi:site-specific DNA-methyltransferase (adenine-specific)
VTNTGTVTISDYRTLLRTLPDGSVSLVFTDPPFGIGYQNNYTSKQHDVICGDETTFSYAKLANETARVLCPGGAAFVFTCWSEYGHHADEFRVPGLRVREPLICEKRASGKTNLHSDWQSNSDWILYVTKGPFRFRTTQLLRNKRAGCIPNKGRKPVAEFKTRFPSSWFGPDFPFSTANPSEQKKWPHPALKSQTFAEWLIQIATDEGGLVVDPFCGAGTIPAAAAATGRRFVAGDLLPKFAAMTRKRLEEP